MKRITGCITTLALTAASASIPVAMMGQTAETNAAAPIAQPWQHIPVPKLHAFKPQQPKRIVFSNGLVLFLQEDHELPFVSGFIEMRGGERDEPAGKEGLTDLYAESWRTSGTANKNGDALDDLLEAKAAKIETDSGSASTSLAWDCLKKDTDLVSDLALDLLLHPTFQEPKLMLAKQQLATGIVRRNDDAEGIASRESTRLVYGPNSIYGRQAELATVMGVTVADLKAWHKQTLTPNNMIVAISGDFDSAAMEKKLRQALEPLPKAAPWPKAQDQFPGPKPGIYAVEKADVNQSNIWMVALGTERSNPDYYALTVMNQIFSGGFGSRLFQEVRTHLGLAYSVSGGYGAAWDHPGVFRVVAGTKSVSTVQAIQAMQAEVEKLKTKPFTDSELQHAKDEILNSFIFEYDSKDKVLAAQVKFEFYGYPADYLEKYQQAVEKVTLADLERVAKKYIDAGKLATLVVGNPGQIEPALSTLGPVQKIDIAIPRPAGMVEGAGEQP